MVLIVSSIGSSSGPYELLLHTLVYLTDAVLRQGRDGRLHQGVLRDYLLQCYQEVDSGISRAVGVIFEDDLDDLVLDESENVDN